MANNRYLSREVLQEIIQQIVAAYAPERIILFGSYAYGEPHAHSDVDLLIIKETDKRPLDRWMEVKRLLRDRSRAVSISPLVYTRGEIEHRLAIKDFFIKKVLEKGEVVYG